MSRTSEECALCEGAGEVAKNFGLYAAENPEIVECPDCAGRGVRVIPAEYAEQREFPGYICTTCGAWDSGSPGPRRAPWCDGACSHPRQEMDEIVFVRREERDSFREALGILAGMCSPVTMERYRRELNRRRDPAALDEERAR